MENIEITQSELKVIPSEEQQSAVAAELASSAEEKDIVTLLKKNKKIKKHENTKGLHRGTSTGNNK